MPVCLASFYHLTVECFIIEAKFNGDADFNILIRTVVEIFNTLSDVYTCWNL